MPRKLAKGSVVTFGKRKIEEFTLRLRPIAYSGQDLILVWVPFTGKFVVQDRGVDEEFDRLEDAAEVYTSKYNTPSLRNPRQKRKPVKRKRKIKAKGIKESKLFQSDAKVKKKTKSLLSGSIVKK